MDPFIAVIIELLTTTLAAEGLNPPPEGLADLIEQPPDPALGDYALPCFTMAKALRKGPPAIAAQLASAAQAHLKPGGLISAVEPAGPYLNFRVDVAAMAAHTVPAILSGAYFAEPRATPREKVMVEYSQPNTHKAFHVGHMRNVALGDALVRILEYNGHPVVAANYIGDVGTHIARCLWFHQNHLRELPPEHQAPPASDHPEERGEWLGLLYTAATQKIERAEESVRIHYDREVSRVLQELEAGEGQVYTQWQDTREWSLRAFNAIYGWLGARFDHVFYESEMERPGRDMVTSGLERGVFARSQGAVGVDLEPHGLGFFLVLKGDGTTLYATKDLALGRIKFEQFDIRRAIYVVGAEQTLHFKQVFKTLELLGYEQAAHCHHLAYGLVVLPDGKMSSRAGNTIMFSELRRQMHGYIETNYMSAHRGDWPEAEIEETSRQIAVAAIRYGMVKQDPSRQIVFALEDWLVSEGDTGTYLCYAYTRIQSILRQAAQARRLAPDPAADLSLLSHENERILIRQMQDFNRVAARAARQLRPNLVANTLFTLCKSFSRAYTTCSVLHAESEALALARLTLFAATGVLLREGLSLIGITPPERM
ncbi:MAG: arginine--tRNA ligase [Deltaproteobacteria bacterium]|nr:arginine--tRNA ligase [Deltaproteobacteria bacterium]